MSYEIQTGLIAGAVSWVGAGVSILVTRIQANNERRKLRYEIESVRQRLQREVLARRLAAYAALWKVMITHDLNWVLEGRPLGREWADSFLKALNECKRPIVNAVIGFILIDPSGG